MCIMPTLFGTRSHSESVKSLAVAPKLPTRELLAALEKSVGWKSLPSLFCFYLSIFLSFLDRLQLTSNVGI